VSFELHVRQKPMMEDVQSRVQFAVGKMISALDKEVLRKMQVSFEIC